VSYPGMRYEVAATHFVGIAGLGEDAADESDKDPAAAGRLGIFGYDRPPLPLDALQRGASNTALIIQVPPESASPWMAGGGSTVRGISETRSIDPFVASGEKGTYVLMADGSVRFVSKDISPEAFKVMCTIKGDGTMKDSEWQPVPPPKKGGMESRDRPPVKTEKKPNPDKAKPPEKDKARPPEKEKSKPPENAEKPVGKPVGKPVFKPVGKPVAKPPVKAPQPTKSK